MFDSPDAPAEFEKVFRRDFPLLVKTVMALGASRQEAEDAAAEAMCKLLRKWHRVQSPRAWARRVAAHHFIKERQRDEKGLLLTAEGGHVTPEALTDRALLIWEDQQWVDQLLELLPPAQREAMSYVVEQFKPAEIAEVLGKSPATVRKNLQLAREHLKADWDEFRDPGEGRTNG